MIPYRPIKVGHTIIRCGWLLLSNFLFLKSDLRLNLTGFCNKGVQLPLIPLRWTLFLVIYKVVRAYNIDPTYVGSNLSRSLYCEERVTSKHGEGTPQDSKMCRAMRAGCLTNGLSL